MTITELLQAAAERAVPVVLGIRDDQLHDPTPCSQWDVRALADHLHQVVVGFQALAAKRDFDFGVTPRYVEENGAGWRNAFARQTAALVAAWAAPGAEEGVTGAHALPARTMGFVALGDLTVHAWDLARATGQQYMPAPAVVKELEPVMAELVPLGRETGAYGKETPVSADADAFDRLLGLTGRDPQWRPSGR